MKKNHRELLKLLPPGYSIGWPVVPGTVQSQRARLVGVRGHPYVLDPDGKPIRDRKGIPLRVCSTPRGGSSSADTRRVRELARSLEPRPTPRIS